MSTTSSANPAPEARILCVSCRSPLPAVSRLLRIELEDVASSVDAVDIVAPAHSPVPTSRVGRAVTHVAATAGVVASSLRRLSPAVRPSPRYRLVVVDIQSLDDLYMMQAWSALRAPAEITACFIDELYTRQFAEHRGAIAHLARFDLLFVGCEGTVEALEKAVKRPCRYLAPSVDALAACPYPSPAERVIDVYAMGRRPDKTHAALLARAARTGRYYYYDTTRDSRALDRHEHRRHLIERIQRSRYFLVNVARCTEPWVTGHQEEFGYRYFEGAGTGAVLFGHVPRNAAARAFLDWPDAVIPLEFDSDAVDAILDELDADPERVERIRRANVVNVLRRHDHAHRWEEILRAAELAPMPALEERRRTLNAMADQIEDASTVIPLRRGALL